jgi:hypothetical protein
MRTLYCTLGFERSKVTEAMRALGHDKIVIVTSEENTRSDAYRELLEINALASTPLETLLVDKFDLMAAFLALAKHIEEAKERKELILMNVAGGTRALSVAATLVAFQCGVEAYHIEGQVMRLPQLNLVSIGERLTEEEKEVLAEIHEATSVEAIGRACASISDFERRKQVLLGLRRKGLLTSSGDGKGIMISLTSLGEYYRIAVIMELQARS